MKQPYVVAIGASTGGVSALQELAAKLPPNFPAIMLVVQHIGIHRSVLPELLQGRGPNPAVHATHGLRPVPGTIYVAPPDRHLSLDGDRLSLRCGPKENHTRPAIDPLFRSVALHCRERAIGVLLTGQLDDGAAGLCAIKQCGGRTIVQDPQTALEPGMPMNALLQAEIDFCLALEDIPAALVAMVSAAPPSAPDAGEIPEDVEREVRINQGTDTLDPLLQVGQPSGLTCPDCGGALFEIEGGRPLRFRCHTGHAYSPRNLQYAQREVVEAALWSGARALQEKALLLRRLATVARSSGQTAEAEAGEKRGAAIEQQARELARMIESDPAGGA
ncbi:chemotaxis protein CheB [Variovorax sp. J22P271]|uniref:chemotaxis protein CheB n=1 Tax=Variovorax davisae TaxID=3053515 RepID=UPI002577625B|nr:chemotaxis protein CheB [Variovorax sp. J22P271]MDM0032186.1 chemotaxis protein CheB [Variovorax sp. J22P271]